MFESVIFGLLVWAIVIALFFYIVLPIIMYVSVFLWVFFTAILPYYWQKLKRKIRKD